MSYTDRIVALVAGFATLLLGGWIAFIVFRFAAGAGWFDFGVRLVLNEFAFATIALGAWLIVTAFLPAPHGERLIGWFAMHVARMAYIVLGVFALSLAVISVVGFCDWLGLL